MSMRSIASIEGPLSREDFRARGIDSSLRRNRVFVQRVPVDNVHAKLWW